MFKRIREWRKKRRVIRLYTRARLLISIIENLGPAQENVAALTSKLEDSPNDTTLKTAHWFALNTLQSNKSIVSFFGIHSLEEARVELDSVLARLDAEWVHPSFSRRGMSS